MAKTIILVLAVAYYLLVSGFVFEATKSTETERVDIPYSFAFSTQRVNLIGLQTKDDAKVIRWLMDSDSTIPIQSDYNGNLMCWEYGIQTRVAYLNYMGKRYVFVTEWSGISNEWVTGFNGGLRKFTPIPYYGVPVFQSGDAKVYLVG